jgi:hypothetical protein
MTPRSVVAAVVLLALMVAGDPVTAADTAGNPVAAADTPVEVDGPLPRLGDVGPVEGAPAGLSITPAVTESALEPGRRVEVTHVVANATDEVLELRIETSGTPVGEEGPRPRTDGGDDDAAVRSDREEGAADGPVRLVAPVSELRLGPGEAAELRSTGEVAAGASGVVALQATTPAGDRATALVVLADGSAAGDLAVGIREGGDGGVLAVVELRPSRHAVVDVRIRVRGWAGTASDRTLADLVVGPDRPREVAVDRPAGALPGRLHVEVVAVDRAGAEARASLTTRAGPAGWVPVVAALLLLGAVAVVVAVGRRRLRSGGPPPSLVEEPGP